MSDVLWRLTSTSEDDPEYGLGNFDTMYRGCVEPVPMRREFLLVVRRPDGKRHVIEKRDLDHARDGVEDMLRDMKRSPYYFDASVWIESRLVGEWSRFEEEVDGD